ncbi:hypothetical protein COR50_00900 [Chitinophaga caeni]|uniref:DUF4136 domain-containing protein n=1 Tax=Chitinophaga caeni TaxID=2029983 RepID=A0A291QPH5_9BACT|nr:hypothetical protein [Chitinophaga caeni]ATL45831.1 hypothetical protein COR50_00900 [Chitinophaga caeni]
MKKYIYAYFILCILSISACNTTEITSSWKAQDVTLKHYDKILVVALTGNKDRDIRVSVETAMAKALKAQGFNAVTAFQQYGPRIEDRKVDEEKAVARLREDGFDGAFVIPLLDKSKEKHYSPGYYYYSPFWGYYNNFWWSYNMMYSRVYDPYYYTTTTNYVLEANFYDLSDKKLLYSAQTKSFDPGSASRLASDFSKVVIQDMMKGKIIN